MNHTARACAALAVLLVLAVALAACSGNPKVTRVGAGSVTDLSGRWNDTDSRLVSEQMIGEMLGNRWYGNWDAANDDNPVVVVARVKNDTMEHINTGAFVADLEHELINTGKISFTAGDSDREAVRRERLDQLSNAAEETIKQFGREVGADFMLFGTVTSFVDEVAGTRAVTYQIDMYLVDIEKNLKVWAGQKKIKKIIKRPGRKL